MRSLDADDDRVFAGLVVGDVYVGERASARCSEEQLQAKKIDLAELEDRADLLPRVDLMYRTCQTLFFGAGGQDQGLTSSSAVPS